MAAVVDGGGGASAAPPSSNCFAFARRCAFFLAAFDCGFPGLNSSTMGPISSPFSMARRVAGPGAQELHFGMPTVLGRTLWCSEERLVMLCVCAPDRMR